MPKFSPPLPVLASNVIPSMTDHMLESTRMRVFVRVEDVPWTSHATLALPEVMTSTCDEVIETPNQLPGASMEALMV